MQDNSEELKLDRNDNTVNQHQENILSGVKSHNKNKRKITPLLIIGIAIGVIAAGAYAYVNGNNQHTGESDQNLTSNHTDAKSCQDLFKNANKIIKSEFSKDPEGNIESANPTISLSQCEDLNKDGQDEIIIALTGLPGMSGQRPLYKIFQSDGSELKEILFEMDGWGTQPGFWVDELKVLSQTHNGWKNLESQAAELDKNKKVVYAWNGKHYIESSSIKSEPNLNNQIDTEKITENHYVNAFQVNIRHNPSIKSEIISTADFNLPVKLTGKTQIEGEINWVQVHLLESEQTGWISDSYLSAEKTIVDKILFDYACIIFKGEQICVGDKIAKYMSDGHLLGLTKTSEYSIDGNGLQLSSFGPTNEFITQLIVDASFEGKTEDGIGVKSSRSELEVFLNKQYSHNGELKYLTELWPGEVFDNKPHMYNVVLKNGNCINIPMSVDHKIDTFSMRSSSTIECKCISKKLEGKPCD